MRVGAWSDSGAAGQGLRYAVVGVAVALVYLLTTTTLAEVFSVAFQLALVIGLATAVVVHFTLQRLFVWVRPAPFALPIHEQVGRYLLVVAVQYALTAASTAVLPSALGLPVMLVYLMTVTTLAGTNFLVFRGRVFHLED